MNPRFKVLIVFFVLLQGCSLVLQAQQSSASKDFSGVYRNSDSVLEFKDGKVFQYRLPERTLVYESTYFVKGDKVYVPPNTQESAIMIRRVAVVHTISGKKLIASYLEDLDTGDIFYKNRKPKLIYTKE